MVKIVLPELHCNQCNHIWTPRFEDVRVCPKCKSPYFDLPKRIVRKKDKVLKEQGIAVE